MPANRDARRIPAAVVPLVRRVMKTYTRLNVWVFRKSRGRVWTRFPGGYPICVVGMRGAKSGAWREVGLIHLPVPGREGAIYLVASQGGLPKNPAWYYNVKAHPELTVLRAGRTWSVRARLLSAADKAAAWPDVCALYPPFAEYQARTDRDIPVFLCEPCPGRL